MNERNDNHEGRILPRLCSTLSAVWLVAVSLLTLGGCGKTKSPTQPSAASPDTIGYISFQWACNKGPSGDLKWVWNVEVSNGTTFALYDSVGLAFCSSAAPPSPSYYGHDVYYSRRQPLTIRVFGGGAGGTADYSFTYPAQDTIDCGTITPERWCSCAPSVIIAATGSVYALYGNGATQWPPGNCP